SLARLVALFRGASAGDAGGGIALQWNGAPGLLRQTFPLQPPPLHLPVRVSGLAGSRTDPRALTCSNEAHPGIIMERTSSDWQAGELVGEGGSRSLPLG